MKMMTSAVLFVLVLASAGPAAAGDVSGTWAITVHGSGAHHELQASLTLQQDGKRLAGKLAVHANEHAVSGEVEGTTLRLVIEREGHDEMTMTATLKEDGTLAGYISGPMVDMQWTASRVKDK